MARALPSAEELRRQQIARSLSVVTQKRNRLLLLGGMLLAVVVLGGPIAVWQWVALGVMFLLLAGITVFDLRRAGRRYTLAHAPLDMSLAALAQTGVVFLTGAIESPALPIYIAVAFLTGAFLGRSRGTWVVAGIISCGLWAMTLGVMWGVLPRPTPSLFGLAPGFAHSTVYVLFKAVVMQWIVLITVLLGRLVNDLVGQLLGQAIDAREHALETLGERNRALGELTAAIAHELKNPLASVQGLVQLLERRRRVAGGASDEGEARRWEVLQREIGRMREILDDFVNFSRPLGELTTDAVELQPLLEELTLLHEQLAQRRELTIVGPPTLPAETVCADPRKLKQALINLLQNALQSAPPGSAVRWIVTREGDQLRCGVRDEGPGIPEELLERATAVGVTTRPEGSGIGLAVARGIAEQHGGRLLLRNPPEGGCEALLELPQGPTPPEAEQRGARPAPEEGQR